MLPPFDENAAKRLKDSDIIYVADIVVEQLNHLVSSNAHLYPYHPFHNFGHASMVMSIIKCKFVASP